MVVIAIIAILATVSVVGYTAFLSKANESNAMTEAAQVEEAIKADLMAGNEFVIGTVTTEATTDAAATSTKYVVKYNADDEVYSVYANDEPVAANTDLTAAFNVNPDFAALNGKFVVAADGNITYTYAEGATATIELN
ncbi:MAG: hypothetical protein IJV87_00085 [Clostridia bacterium]|nr:hypothetical protein [Clostridia bacterium]